MAFNEKMLLQSQQQREKPHRSNTEANKLAQEDRPAHRWYRFVLSYPPHLVREYLHKFNVDNGQRVLDPFCGTGTTLVECKKLGIPSIGIEANPVAHFASQTKVDWTSDPDQLVDAATSIADEALEQLNKDGILDDPVFFNWQPGGKSSDLQLRTLDSEQTKLLLTNSISPLPLHKALVLRECIERYRQEDFYNHLRIAFADALTFTISNLQFGPEVGVGTIKEDSPVIAIWLEKVNVIANDLRALRRF